jgi:hypothetical protein
MDRLEVHLQSHLTMASICVSNPALSQPSTVNLNAISYGLQVRMIAASICISTLSRSQPPSVSLNLHDSILPVCTIWPPSESPHALDHILQVYLEICFIKNSGSRSSLSQSLSVAMDELGGRQPILNAPPHHLWHQQGTRDIDQFNVEEHSNRVRAC